MKRFVKGTTGRSTSTEYIKNALFDYLADFERLEIEGVPAEEVVNRIEKLGHTYDIDDILEYSADNGLTLVQALEELEDEFR